MKQPIDGNNAIDGRTRIGDEFDIDMGFDNSCTRLSVSISEFFFFVNKCKHHICRDPDCFGEE